jgi:glycosyltransferase involved in cell wall biosynthesis
MHPLVSVIIPSYNCEAYIAETIDSVLAQDYSSIELLIVDDGSTDKTQDIIQTYGHQVRLISQRNAGVCAARNKGIQEAKGQYICLMDHDDYWYPDKISRQVRAFAEQPETGVVYSTFTLWHPDSSGIFPRPDSFSKIAVDDDIDQEFSGWIYHLLLLDCWVLTSTTMFRSEVFQTCGVFDETLPYSEDWELWLRISRQYPFLKIRQTTTLYRQHMHQGNRKVRPIDYRTVLLLNSVKSWGLCSQDGRCLSKLQFYRQIAEYHASFGLLHLIAGNKKIAIISLFKSWTTFPFKLKYVAYLVAGLSGWKPGW